VLICLFAKNQKGGFQFISRIHISTTQNQTGKIKDKNKSEIQNQRR
jgi:hypothetical protein